MVSVGLRYAINGASSKTSLPTWGRDQARNIALSESTTKATMSLQIVVGQRAQSKAGIDALADLGTTENRMKLNQIRQDRRRNRQSRRKFAERRGSSVRARRRRQDAHRA